MIDNERFEYNKRLVDLWFLRSVSYSNYRIGLILVLMGLIINPFKTNLGFVQTLAL